MIPKHLEIALSYTGKLKEIGNNQGWNDKEFEKLAIQAGWRKGCSWCAFFIKICLMLAGAKIHKKWAGLARDYWTYAIGKKYTITEILNGNYKEILKPGMLVIYQKGDSEKGHIGMIKEVLDGYKMLLAEGNTSNSDKGSQDNGDVATIKNRPISRGTLAWHILGAVEVEYEIIS
jgi:hypothetical protein